MSEVRVDADELRGFVAQVLQRVGVVEQDARVVADVLVTADLRGHESHGVARLDRFYVEPIERGRIAPRAQTAVVRETAATAVLDAGYGLGHPAAQRAMELCIAKAREAGTCVATVRHSNHYGIAGYYAMLALPHDMIGVSSTNALALVVPTGGRRPVFGSNPIAFAAPAGRHRPFVLDMATSMVPSGKVEVKARRGEPLPPGWAVDDVGRPTSEAQAVLDRLDRGLAGGLMPLGGVDAGHKGYGLGVMVDILCGILAGAGAGLTVYGDADERGRPADVGHLCVAIDPAAFGAIEEFKASMDAYIDALNAEAPAPGTDRVRVAGEPEFETEEQRQREGIPLHERVVDELRALGRRVGVSAPFRS